MHILCFIELLWPQNEIHIAYTVNFVYNEAQGTIGPNSL